MLDRILTDLVEQGRRVLADDLRSVVLYGSAADGKQRPSSDVNVIFVLTVFNPARILELRATLVQYQAAVRLAVMFLRHDEIADAAGAFAAKFADILRRRRVLYGDDPFADLTISRDAEIYRLRQVLLNLVLRLRAAYAYRADEALTVTIADAAGPLRSCAALLLQLEGVASTSPKAALEAIGQNHRAALSRVSEARETRQLAADVAGPTLLELIELAEIMRCRALALS